MQTKVLSLKALLEKLLPLREKGDRIVFTYGWFDIVPVWHVRSLSAARADGDLLILGLNSDRSVATIKGPQRPIVPEDQRAEVLAGLWCIDFITLFDEPDPFNLIRALRPDVLVKGDDWPEDQIIGADIVKAGCGKVVRVPLAQGSSTTLIIEQIIKNYT